MLTIIVMCEVLFWVMLALGLVVRYVLRRRELSTALLVSTPLIDLVLVVVTMLDLGRGATPHFSHGLSAFYIGFSVVFGPDVIRWADERVAYRWGDGPEPVGPERSAAQEVVHQWSEWRRAVTASSIAGAVLVAGIVVAGWSGSFWLLYWLVVLVFLVGCWGAIGPLRAARRAGSAETRSS